MLACFMLHHSPADSIQLPLVRIELIDRSELYIMDSKKLECRQCQGTEVLRRDSQTGMWELMIGHASISNSSWQYLEETWLDIHHRGCKERQSQRLYCA